MATNFEFYKDEILKIAQKQATPVLTRDGDISGCNFIDCKKCAFRGSDCRSKQMNWLYAEHIEQPKLTKRERAFCEAVQQGWVAKYEKGAVWSSVEPIYREAETGRYYMYHNDSGTFRIPFMFHLFEQLKPWQTYKVKDLLKLDVIEEVQGE